MGGLTLHDGGSAGLEVVLPEAPWAGSGVLDRGRSAGGRVMDDAAVDALAAQARSSEPGPSLAGVLELLTAPGAAVDPGRPVHDGSAGAGSGAVSSAVSAGVLDRLDAVELAATVAAAERLVSWVRAMQARAAAALIAAQGGVLGLDQAETVVKDRLHVTAKEGGTIVRRADRCVRFPDVLDALEAGRIDARKADTLLGAGAELTDEERAAAIVVLLPEAPTRTWKWLSDQLNALANRLHGSEEDLTEAAAGSNVWLETAAPGMALLSALMPAKDAARVFNAVQAGADQLMRQPGRRRRRGQARADALTSLVTGRMVPPLIEEVTDDGLEEVTADEGAADGEADTEEAHTTQAHDSGVHNETTVGETGGRPGGRPPGGSAPGKLRAPVTGPGVLVPPVRDTDLVPVPEENDGILSTAPVPARAKSPAVNGAEAGVVVRAVEVPATINVTVPASVLADPGDDTPGILDLLGPIPAATAREIAGEGIWHRLVTDPVTGILTDYSTTTYQPPPRLRRAVQARDRTCAHEGCDRPATRCDLDHIDPFDKDRPYRPGEPGQTRASNLHALCRRHHNLKSLAGWHVDRDPVTGVETWTSPTGHTETYRPDPTDPTIRYATVNSTTITDTTISDPTLDLTTDNLTTDNTAPPVPPATGLTLARPPRPKEPAIPDKPTARPTHTTEPPF